MRREKAYYVVDCRVGDYREWIRGWFQFHAGPNRRYAKKMFEQAKSVYAHHPRLSVRMRKWVRPSGAGTTHGWMSERQP